MTRIKYILFTLLFGFFVLFNIACSDSEQASGAGDSKQGSMNIQQLMASAEQSRQQASEAGFEWNTIQALLDKGHEAMAKGDEGLAYNFFSEAKAHAELAIAQAKYADENWQLLIPEN